MIPQEEYDNRVRELVPKLAAKMTADSQETNELFTLYNDRFKPFETGKHCAACRQRVFKKLQAYYETIKTSIP